MSNPSLFIFALAFSAEFVTPLHAVGFLKIFSGTSNDTLTEADIRTSLLSEIESDSGAFDTSSRISLMKEALQPIFAALPKNKYGNLDRTAVRYALHRVFVMRHGWVIKGLSPHASPSNSSSKGVLKDKVPAYIEDLFEKRLHGKGLHLKELAIVGATLEHLIHNEAVDKLGEVYDVHGFLPTDVISSDQADQLLDTYMMGYIRSRSFKNMTRVEAKQLVGEMKVVYLAWGETQKFVRGIRTSIAQNRVDFIAMSKVVGAVNERFGSFQDQDCAEVKASLMKMEYSGSGRVKLADFYAPARNGQWQFQESLPYLKQLGVIDDFDRKNPSVMIPNYVASHANCIATSGFYTICCKNECEGILGYLEQKIAAPEGKTGVIATLVANLSSSTVLAPRELSANLLRRLDDIAMSHNGGVPLHGRLFAQWMHHAYPLECPFPHVAGTTSSLTADDWEIENGVASVANDEEMSQYVARASALAEEAKIDGGVAPWSFEEELLLGRTSSHGTTWSRVTSMPVSMRIVILVIASASLLYSLAQSSKSRLVMGKDSDLKMV